MTSKCWVCGEQGLEITNGYTCDECEVRWGKPIKTTKMSDRALAEQGYDPCLSHLPSPG